MSALHVVREPAGGLETPDPCLTRIGSDGSQTSEGLAPTLFRARTPSPIELKVRHRFTPSRANLTSLAAAMILLAVIVFPGAMAELSG